MAKDKISDRADKAEKIRAATKNAGGDTAKRLERMLERAEKQIKSLGKTKLSILHGSLRRFNGHYSRLTNVEDIASNDKDKERLIQFKDTLPDMENTIKKVSYMERDNEKKHTRRNHCRCHSRRNYRCNYCRFDW